ncbi:MAG: hypothetical protein ACR2FP_08755 [Nocardioidaceae bacterium]
MSTDSLRTVFLAAHIVAGTVAVLIAAKVMAAGVRQDWSTRWGTGYVASVIIVAASAAIVTTVGPTLPVAVRWILLLVAIATAAAALRGRQLARRDHAWLDPTRPAQLRLMWGSVTSLVSAIAIVSAPAVVWTPVVIAGTFLTEPTGGLVATPAWPPTDELHASSPRSQPSP